MKALTAAAALLGAFIATAVILIAAHSDTNQGFYAGNWPQADWRPFSDSSPFNQPIPANPQLTSDSASKVATLTSGGSPNPIRINIQGTSSDFYKPTYWARSSDPLYKITGTYKHHDETLHLPQGAQSAGGSDHHLTDIDGDTHWGFWNACVNNSTHTINGCSGSPTTRKASLTGSGTSNDGECGAVAAGFCNLAGLIRAQELSACTINHALFITSSKTSGGLVYPAAGSGDGGTSGGLPEGSRLQLDPTLDISGFGCAKRAVLGAFQKYGAYLGDTSGASSFAFGVESDTQYVSLVNPRTGQKFAARLPIFLHGSDLTWSDVPWSRLRVVAPCVTERTC